MIAIYNIMNTTTYLIENTQENQMLIEGHKKEVGTAPDKKWDKEVDDSEYKEWLMRNWPNTTKLEQKLGKPVPLPVKCEMFCTLQLEW